MSERIDLNEIERLLSEATAFLSADGVAVSFIPCTEANAKLIAAMGNAVPHLLAVVTAALRINEATKHLDRDWLGLPPEASDEWVAGFFAALRSLDDNSHIGKCLAPFIVEAPRE